METFDHTHLAPLTHAAKRADLVQMLKLWRSDWKTTDSSFSVLTSLLISQKDVVEDLRKKVVGEISSWASDNLEDISQGSFWKFYEAFSKSNDSFLYFSGHGAEAADISDYQVGELDLSTRVPRIQPARSFDLFVIDGPQRLQFSASMELGHVLHRPAVRTLSLRAIRALTRSAVSVIEKAELSSVSSLIQLARDTLSREIRQRVRWRASSENSIAFPTLADMTREQVLCFQLRTGNPPPFDHSERRIGAVVVPMTLGNASKVDHETVFEQSSRRNIRNALRAGIHRATVDRSSQAASTSRGGPQSSRRRRLRTDLRLGETARSSRYPSRRQMVFDVQLDRRGGPFRDPARATIDLKREAR